MLNKYIEIITDPFKSMLVTVSGAAAGSVPKVATIIADTQMTNLDRLFQMTAWVLTILVALSALISFAQKQIDRYKSKHQHHEKDS